MVARAVAVEGFKADDRIFPDWSALFAFLEEQFIAGREALPALTPQSVERILRNAPRSVLEGLLDRVENDLLPNRQWDAVGELLARFLAVDSAATDGLRSRAAELLVRWQQTRSGAEQRWHRLVDPAQAPLTTAKYGLETLRAHAERIRQAGFFPAAPVIA
jgi:hypothetical protein